MNELVLRSKEIFDVAMATYNPMAVGLMLSGGDDSMTCYHVAKELGIKLDFVMHGNTRTGIPDTTEFAMKEIERMGDRAILADAGSSYVDYVMRKGFFGKGIHAHSFSYHILKWTHFRREVSKHIRKRKRNFPILFLNGARQSESANRMVQMVSPYKIVAGSENNIWVNLINHWDKEDCKQYLDGNGITRNPVSIQLCRSGECMCGTMQTAGDRYEAHAIYPKWGKWLNELEKAAIDKHGFGWNDKGPKKKDSIVFPEYQPMCQGCKIDYKEQEQ